MRSFQRSLGLFAFAIFTMGCEGTAVILPQDNERVTLAQG